MILYLSTLHNISIARRLLSFLMLNVCNTSYRLNTAISFGNSFSFLSIPKLLQLNLKKEKYEKRQ